MIGTFKAGPDRAKLGFKEAALSAFDFLRQYGFTSTQANATFVRYESPSVFVNAYHGRGSYELGIEIGRLDDPDRNLAIANVVDWAGAFEAEGFGKHVMFQVATREGVQKFVVKLADLVKKYAVPLLRNEANAWNEALGLQVRRAAEYEKDIKLRQIREKAEKAWHAKDYAQVVELYGPVRKDLTKVDAKKLAYAEQQVLTGVGPSSRKKR